MIKPEQPQFTPQKIEETKKEIHMNGRGRRIDETAEEYKAEREVSWAEKQQLKAEDSESTEQPRANKPLSTGDQKIEEYINRIKSGESKESIFQGLPKTFKLGIEKRLASDVLKSRRVIDDQKKANAIREKLGLPLQEVRQEGSLPSDKNTENKNGLDKPNYERIANNIPIDEKKPLKPEGIGPILGGNMFGENDHPTLAGQIIAKSIYDKLVQRLGGKPFTVESVEKVIQSGKEDLEDFKKYILELSEGSKKSSGKSLGFSVERPAGKTGFHLNGEDGNVGRDHLFYFNKTSKEYKNPQAQEIRAYLTINPAEAKNIQRHFVDLCTKLYEAGIDFTGKAASPAGLENRTDNMVLYITKSDQEKASQMIKDFLQERKIGNGYVDAATPSPQEGLSWALEPATKDVKLWQNVSGSSEGASFNAVVATKVAPMYLRRLAEAHLRLGNQNEANIFNAEADRVENLIKQAA